MRKAIISIQGPNRGGGGFALFEHIEFGKSVKILVEMSDGMVKYSKGLELKKEI